MEERSKEERSQLVDKLRLDRRALADARMPRRGRRLALGVAATAIVAIAAWAFLATERAPLVQIAVARAAAGAASQASVLDASGYVTARRQATVSAKITGKVVEVLIEEGMHVDEGAVLARLDAAEANAQLELARAQLVAAGSLLEQLRARFEQAERDFARRQALARQGVVSTQEMETARAERDALRAGFANAKDQIRVAQESVNVAQVQVENTEIRAPFAGVVVAKAAQPGEVISPISAGGGFTRTGIGTIVDMDSLEIEVDVNESFINRVTEGQPVEAMLNAYPQWKIPAEVIAVIPTADRSKATVKVRVAIKQKDARIVPDMGVRVAFLSPAPERRDGDVGGVLVPSAAVRSSGDEHVVFVYEGGKVLRRGVTPGPGGQSDRLISSGIDAGQSVVVSPADTLADGDAVRIAETH